MSSWVTVRLDWTEPKIVCISCLPKRFRNTFVHFFMLFCMIAFYKLWNFHCSEHQTKGKCIFVRDKSWHSTCKQINDGHGEIFRLYKFELSSFIIASFLTGMRTKYRTVKLQWTLIRGDISLRFEQLHTCEWQGAIGKISRNFRKKFFVGLIHKWQVLSVRDSIGVEGTWFMTDRSQ